MAFRSPVWLLPPFQSSALPVSRGGSRLSAWRRILPRVFGAAGSWKRLPRGLVPSNAQVARLVLLINTGLRPVHTQHDRKESRFNGFTHFHQGKPPPNAPAL